MALAGDDAQTDYQGTALWHAVLQDARSRAHPLVLRGLRVKHIRKGEGELGLVVYWRWLVLRKYNLVIYMCNGNLNTQVHLR